MPMLAALSLPALAGHIHLVPVRADGVEVDDDRQRRSPPL